MSWNKNTINMSDMDTRIEVLKEVNIPFELKVLKTVKGYGLNDEYGGGKGTYELRSLAYVVNGKTKLFVEQMNRSHECDSDDYIVCFEIDPMIDIQSFKTVVYDDCEEFHEGECEYERKENEKD